MYLVPSLELGPGYSILYLKVCLFDLLNLLFMKFISFAVVCSSPNLHCMCLHPYSLKSQGIVSY